MVTFTLQSIAANIISPFDELVAYEYLYSRDKANLASVTRQTVACKMLLLRPDSW